MNGTLILILLLVLIVYLGKKALDSYREIFNIDDQI